MIDPQRIIPSDGENPYANHPGFDAQGCQLQYTVTPARQGSTSHHGFGCLHTGGHCLPGEHCAGRIASDNQRAAMKQQVEFDVAQRRE